MNSLSIQATAYFKLPKAAYHSDMTFLIIAKGQTLPSLPLFHHPDSYLPKKKQREDHVLFTAESPAPKTKLPQKQIFKE